MDDQKHLDLCEQWKETPAIYTLVNQDIACCTRCARFEYPHCSKKQVVDRSLIRESINEAYRVVLSIRPIALMLNKKSTADDPDLAYHLDILKKRFSELSNKLETTKAVKLENISNKVEKLTTSIYEDKYVLPTMKSLLLFQAQEVSKMRNFEEIDYSVDDLCIVLIKFNGREVMLTIIKVSL